MGCIGLRVEGTMEFVSRITCPYPGSFLTAKFSCSYPSSNYNGSLYGSFQK